MIRVEHRDHFAVPVETGFAFITDIANWPSYWPGFVRSEPGSSWTTPGDEARIVVELLGRETELRLSMRRFEPNRLVEYDSVQPGLPDARHERHFAPAGDGFDYRLVVEYEPRARLRGLYDRLLVRRGIERALRRTTINLHEALPSR
jgi:hypothetical protein